MSFGEKKMKLFGQSFCLVINFFVSIAWYDSASRKGVDLRTRVRFKLSRSLPEKISKPPIIWPIPEKG